MKQIITFIIIYITLCVHINAQTHIIRRSINRNQIKIENKQILDKNSKIYHYFNFNKADFSQRNDRLPIYFELIPINSTNYSVSIRNLEFESLSVDEQKLISKNISERIIYKSEFYKQTKISYLSFSLFPFVKDIQSGQIKFLKSFNIILTPTNKPKFKEKLKLYTDNSVLASGNWIKIKLKKSGIYKITFDELRNAGIANPENIRIFGNGGKMLSFYNSDYQPDDLQEVDLQIKDNSVYFYAQGTVSINYDSINQIFYHQLNLYSDYAYYFISDNYNSGKNNTIKTEQQSAGAASKTITTFNDFAYHEIDSINLIRSGRLWVNELFDYKTEYNFTFDFPNLLAGSTIKLNSSLLARSPISSSFTINLADNTFSTLMPAVSYNYTATYASHKNDIFTTTVSGGNKINLSIIYNKSSASGKAWLDYVSINAERMLKFTGAQMHFQNINSAETGAISNFIISDTPEDLKVWDITNLHEPKEIQLSAYSGSVSFKLNTDSLKYFIAFDETNFLSPEFEGEGTGTVSNQNLHSIKQSDMIIVSPPEFMSYANELKTLHEEKDNLTVIAVSTEQIYNEFSSGAPDASAIRNFVKMLYDRATSAETAPKYLLLFGDGSYDNKHRFSGNTNFIPTYQSANSLSPTQSFVADDFFGLLDYNEGGANGLIDIGIGRLPVSNTQQARQAVDKIKMYIQKQAMGDWRNRLCFIADDEDYALHMSQADQLANNVKNNYPVFNIDKIYLDAYKQESSSVGQRYPDVNKAIDDNIEKGMLLINYTGHGGETGLADERIISVDQINKWYNPYKFFVFMTATCEFSRYDDYNRTSAGEYVFLNQQGGAIAMFTTTRLVYASLNFFLNTNFYKYIFENNPLTGKRYRLGDVMRLTKNASGTGINKRNFSLLGDPALSLSYGKQKIITNSIKKETTGQQTDTLNAFDKINIEGTVLNLNGQTDELFNGILYPTVFDKFKLVKTLNNDGEGVFEYKLQTSKVFKGKATVKNGKFAFRFIVPKDIKYNIDTGKISYYAQSSELGIDAAGFDNTIFIGGSANSGAYDEKPPELNLYLNDENFVSGGITDQNPIIIAQLADESGINTTGTGIGHDISAIIDDNPNMQFILNDFYESETDDFTKGCIKYKLSNLPQGEHKLSLKAWDIFNNSVQDSLFFTVSSDNEFKISHVLNYPNPFTTNTSFFFEHNRPNELLNILIQIFTVSGKIVKSIHNEQISEGYRSEGIPWDGLDDFGNKIGRGVYFYKIRVQTQNNEHAEYIEKLLIF